MLDFVDTAVSADDDRDAESWTCTVKYLFYFLWSSMDSCFDVSWCTTAVGEKCKRLTPTVVAAAWAAQAAIKNNVVSRIVENPWRFLP